MRRIGVDVGGTNTDAVLLEDGAVIHAVKTPTSPDVTTGIVSAVDELSRCLGVTSGVIDAVIIGTTHFVNAVVQRRELARVAAVRIGLPAAASLPPFCDWPLDLPSGSAAPCSCSKAGTTTTAARSCRSTRPACDGLRGRSARAASARSRSPRSFPRSTRTGNSGHGPSLAKSAQMPRSPHRTSSVASVFLNARTPPSSMLR